VRFAVTNPAGDISNYITFCITLQQRGGDGTGNLTGKKWKIITQTEYDVDGTFIGEVDFTVSLDSQYSLPCVGGGFEIIEYKQSFSLEILFTNDGFFSQTFESYIKIPISILGCGDVTYFEDNISETIEGGWSFNSETQIMSITTNGYYDDEGFYNPPETDEFLVIVNTPTRIEVRVDNFDGYIITVLVPA